MSTETQIADRVLQFPYKLCNYVCEEDARSTINCILSTLQCRLPGLKFEGENFQLKYHGRPYAGYVRECHKMVGEGCNLMLQGTVEVGLYFLTQFPVPKRSHWDLPSYKRPKQFPKRNRLNGRLERRLIREFEELLPMEKIHQGHDLLSRIDDSRDFHWMSDHLF